MRLALLSLRNYFDYYLRSLLKWGRKVKPSQIDKRDLKFQSELKIFLEGLKLDSYVTQGKEIVVLDVGARNFSSGPVIDELFASFGIACEIHGIEIDSYRRLSTFHLRADFGKYFATQMRNGHFHPSDFLKWKKEADIIFMLNPFVTKEPLVSWGLPLSFFKPKEIFNKCYELTRKNRGIIVLSCPSEEEYEIALEEARIAGFRLINKSVWKANASSTQKRNRYGAVLIS
jgi:hypothetical protein